MVIEKLLIAILNASNKYRKFTYRNTKYSKKQILKSKQVFDRFTKTFLKKVFIGYYSTLSATKYHSIE